MLGAVFQAFNWNSESKEAKKNRAVILLLFIILPCIFDIKQNFYYIIWN